MSTFFIAERRVGNTGVLISAVRFARTDQMAPRSGVKAGASARDTA